MERWLLVRVQTHWRCMHALHIFKGVYMQDAHIFIVIGLWVDTKMLNFHSFSSK